MAHLVSLVLQSKKALQHGEQLCSRANSTSAESAQCTMDVLALDAKLKWISEAVLEQLKLAATVAKIIQEKRLQLVKQVEDWDAIRGERTDELDAILESLGSQLVPPDFHQGSSESSLFGSQHSESETERKTAPIPIPQNLAATLREEPPHRRADRKKWKTLRDFVDERAIEDVLETIESDRTALDDTLARTEGYSESLTTSIAAIRSNLRTAQPLPSIEGILKPQQKASTALASHLESLAAHYDQMVRACSENEAGEEFSESDLQEMNRDTEELPAIMAELEESAASIDRSYQELVAARDAGQQQLDAQRNTLNDLDELGDIITEMLQLQEGVEADFADQLEGLKQHILTLEDLHHRFKSYHDAFSKLLVEIARRRQYREGINLIIKNLSAQLDFMTEEETQVRNDFNAEHGQYLPADVCLCIENPPTKWEIVPCNGEALEALPEIDNDLLVQAKDRLSGADGHGVGLSPESL